MAPTQCTPIKNNNTNINVHHAHLSDIMPTSPATPAGDKATIVINHEVKQGLPRISGSQHGMHDRSLPISTTTITTGSAATSSRASSVYEEEEEEEENNKLLVGVEDTNTQVEDTEADNTTAAATSAISDTDIDTAPRAAARAEPPGAPEELVLTHVRVRIQKRPSAEHDNINNINTNNTNNYETVVLRELRLPLPVTLDSMRSALTRSELGDTRRDIFFPSWTKSLYVMWNTTTNNEQLETIESNAALVEALDKVGDLTLLLQECRNARYSRRNNNSNMGYYYVYNAHAYNNNNNNNGRKHHGKRNNNNNMNNNNMGTRSPFTTYRVDRPVYYDYDNNYNNNNNNQALYNYMHPAALAAAYGCLLPHHVHNNNNNNNSNSNNGINGQAALEGASIAYMPAPFVVPFMYAPPQH